MYCALNRWSGQPIVLNTDGQEWRRGKWGRVGRAVFHGSARISRHCATGLISDCEAMAEIYREDFGAASTVIPYCFPDRELRTGTGVLERFDLSREGFYVIAGRLNPENNIDAVARAYAASAHPESLLVLGAANYGSPVVQELEALADQDPRIRVGGHIGDRDEFLELLGAAKGYIHGHSVGGMNPSLVEAMGAGAFIIAFDTPFNREVLGPAGSFFRVESLDRVIGDLARLSTAEIADRRAATAARARDEYAIDAVVGAYEELLVTAAKASPRDIVTIPTRWARP
jgi:glycosyltransferase involved in cell wall biosynthesis